MRAHAATELCNRNDMMSNFILELSFHRHSDDFVLYVSCSNSRSLRHRIDLEIFNVRATVATHTLAAPARIRTRAHSEAVVPVVKTSSTNKMSRFTFALDRHNKGAAHVLSPLMASKSDLTSSLPAAQQNSGAQGQTVFGRRQCFNARGRSSPPD